MDNFYENELYENESYLLMLDQLTDLLHDKEKYIDPDDPDDIINKDVNALKQAINLLKYYPEKINEYEKELDKKEKNNRLLFTKCEYYEDLLNDYRRMYQLIYKLIENNE